MRKSAIATLAAISVLAGWSANDILTTKRLSVQTDDGKAAVVISSSDSGGRIIVYDEFGKEVFSIKGGEVNCPAFTEEIVRLRTEVSAARAASPNGRLDEHDRRIGRAFGDIDELRREWQTHKEADDEMREQVEATSYWVNRLLKDSATAMAVYAQFVSGSKSQGMSEYEREHLRLLRREEEARQARFEQERQRAAEEEAARSFERMYQMPYSPFRHR